MDQEPLKVPAGVIGALRCPGHPELPLQRGSDRLTCEVKGERLSFPIVDGTPILIQEATSVFTIADFRNGGVTTMDLREEAIRFETLGQKLKELVRRSIPPKSRFIGDFSPEAAVRQILIDKPDARILVVGAGDARFDADGRADVVYTDVALAPDTHIVADAHDLPFADETFDAVFAIAVLEHVADPYRCVAEFQRVLRPGGLVYAVTPFMQQVHMGAYDFTRFTALGHRRLFRWFDDIRSGVANGPGMAVTWGVEYFLTSFSESNSVRSVLLILSRFVAWPFLLLDGFLASKAGAYDCASAYYFFGRLRDQPIHDRDIIASYRGMNSRR